MYKYVIKKKTRLCTVCKKKSFDIRESLCRECLNDPYCIETARDLTLDNLDQFLKLYSQSLPEIKNLNTPRFWDERTGILSRLNDQDGMTKDRVYAAYKYLDSKVRVLLDIGAGNGFLEELLTLDNKRKIFANDFSKSSIANLRRRFNGKFKVESIYSMRYKKNYFDAILALEVLEHIPARKIFGVLESINMILKKDGQLIISVPMNEDLKSMPINKNGHVRTYTKNIIISELMAAGFKCEDYKVFYAFNSLYRVKKFLTFLFPKRWKPNNIVVKAKKL